MEGEGWLAVVQVFILDSNYLNEEILGCSGKSTGL